MGSHCMDMIDFLVGPLEDVSAVALNTGRAYPAEDVTVTSFRAGPDVAGSGVWNFNADRTFDTIRLVGSSGSITFPMFSDGDVVVSDGRRFEVRNPPHVHQPLIQTIVDELGGRDRWNRRAGADAEQPELWSGVWVGITGVGRGEDLRECSSRRVRRDAHDYLAACNCATWPAT